jgi:hypothetical protein
MSVPKVGTSADMWVQRVISVTHGLCVPSHQYDLQMVLIRLVNGVSLKEGKQGLFVEA